MPAEPQSPLAIVLAAARAYHAKIGSRSDAGKDLMLAIRSVEDEKALADAIAAGAVYLRPGTRETLLGMKLEDLGYGGGVDLGHRKDYSGAVVCRIERCDQPADPAWGPEPAGWMLAQDQTGTIFGNLVATRMWHMVGWVKRYDLPIYLHVREDLIAMMEPLSEGEGEDRRFPYITDPADKRWFLTKDHGFIPDSPTLIAAINNLSQAAE